MPATTTTKERKPIRDEKSIADHVCDYMHDHHRALSIDTLLTRPSDALVMALAVGVKSGRINARAAKPICRAIDGLQKRDPQTFEAVDEICRVAMNSRKKGALRRDRY